MQVVRTEDSAERLAGVSSEPGVYIMKDDRGNILYVGKAKNLKKRLASYFSGSGHSDPKTGALLRKIHSFDTVITASEKEALILESNLIKRHRPRYNVDLKDDKRYLSLRLDLQESYPNLILVRKIEKDGALYFGPFASAQAVRQTLKFIHRTFKLRQCANKNYKSRIRPCINFQMGWCLAPCCRKVDRRQYDHIVKETILFLKGRTPELVRKIKKEMMSAADAQDYEWAGVLRDKMFALEKTLQHQVAVTTDFMDRDVIGMAGTADFSVITLMSVRGGSLLGTRHFHIQETMATVQEAIGAFIRQYYENIAFIPKEVIVSCCPEDARLLEVWLGNLKGEKVTVVCPLRGEKRKLADLAVQNAANERKDFFASKKAEAKLLSRLQSRLQLSRMPLHIECFDNSNISGTSQVSSMVVFKNARPHRSGYRRYIVRTVSGPDDYAAMAEILKRRYGRKDALKPYPDLLIVDGGKGQLNIALSILEQLHMLNKLDVIGIAKKDGFKGESEDKVYKPGRSNPVSFGRETDLLLFLQRIRDEAHRVAVAFHRRRRAKKTMGSVLDTLPGIGEKRKNVLLKHFGNIRNIRAATIEELGKLPGMNRKAAEAVRQGLAEPKESPPSD